MDAFALTALEFGLIQEKVAEYTVSGLGKKLVERLVPLTSLTAIEAATRETTEAATLLGGRAQVPLHGLSDIDEQLKRIALGLVPGPGDFLRISDLLRGSSKMKKYMKSKEAVVPYLSAYALGITDLADLEERIETSIEGARVSDSASRKLGHIRSEIKVKESRIQEKLKTIMASAQYREYLQESFVSQRDGRYVIPVKTVAKNKLDGVVIAASGSGSTVFIEPAAVRRLADDLKVLQAAEEAEEYQVLAGLAGETALHLPEIRGNVEVMAAYDFALAKGKYSLAVEGVPAQINSNGRINLRQGRHPLIPGQPVPLDFAIGEGYHILVITGPNTGGKTVALKTVGLLTLMAQAGLHIPAAPGSELAVFDRVMADIGDGQSIQQSLSTFSSHIGNIVGIIGEAGPGSLVLLDEIGTGTDPAEGSALAASVLDELHHRGATAVVSTHYSDIKRYAEVRAGFRNGCMEFDRETLQPLFRLKIGEAGSSNALWIAEKLGMPAAMLARARGYLQQQPEAKQYDFAGEAGLEAADAPDKPKAKTYRPSRRPKQPPENRQKFRMGDCVFIHTLNRRGIIAAEEDSQGRYMVLSRGERYRVNHKRLTFFAAREDLYPEDYDLNTVLLSVADRKLLHAMERKHVRGVRVLQAGEKE